MVISWSDCTRYWDCTDGPFSDSEFEVLLYDGEKFAVTKVEEGKFIYGTNAGQKLTIIHLEHDNYTEEIDEEDSDDY